MLYCASYARNSAFESAYRRASVAIGDRVGTPHPLLECRRPYCLVAALAKLCFTFGKTIIQVTPPPAAADRATTAPEFLPDLAKGLTAFLKIGVIGTSQKRAEVFSRDAHVSMSNCQIWPERWFLRC